MVIIRDISVVRVPGVGVPGDDLEVLLLGVVAGVVVGLFWLCGRIADRIGDWRDRRDPERVARREQKIADRLLVRRGMVKIGTERWGEDMTRWPWRWDRKLARELNEKWDAIEAEERAETEGLR